MMQSIFRFQTVYILLSALILWTGCKDSTADTSVATATLGPNGGRVILDDHASADVPAGALAGMLSITIQRLDETYVETTEFIPVGKIYAFSPHGQIFHTPVTLYLPYDMSHVGENVDLVRAFLSTDGGTTWQQLPFLKSSIPGLVGGQTTHFSIAVAGIPSRDDPHPDEGGETGESKDQEGGESVDPTSTGSVDGCTVSTGPGCGGCACESNVCALVQTCCDTAWTTQCVKVCEETGGCTTSPPVEGGEEGEETGGGAGGCSGYCGTASPGDCFCDDECVDFGDCCPNACDLCGHCGGPSCGNGSCTSDESCNSCPADCGPCAPICGNGACEAGENCNSCSSDCGTCFSACGDGACTEGENCENCVSDCGACGQGGLCAGHCGEKSPSGCYCDQQCSQFNDCCTDICISCGFCS